MSKIINVAVLGATGTVGQRLLKLLNNHPFFKVVKVAASSRSKGKKLKDILKDTKDISNDLLDMIVYDVFEDVDYISNDVKVVFSAFEGDPEYVRELEYKYATKEVGVISCNSAHRNTDYVPVIIPEVNNKHLDLINIQRKDHGWSNGFIVVKPNCSIQSYTIVLKALEDYQPYMVNVTSMQAISGAGKTFETWPEMMDNIIPFINGEEMKSENEPLKVLGTLNKDKIKNHDQLEISATCIRVPVSDGHMASIAMRFKTKPTLSQIKSAFEKFNHKTRIDLPNAPFDLINIMEDENRPQTKLDRDIEMGMGISVGRIRDDKFYDYKMVTLSHNTIRGAAGGAILTAEYIYKLNFIK